MYRRSPRIANKTPEHDGSYIDDLRKRSKTSLEEDFDPVMNVHTNLGILSMKASIVYHCMKRGQVPQFAGTEQESEDQHNLMCKWLAKNGIKYTET